MSDTPPVDDYVLGTDDDEIARLAFQHGLWREAATAAWQRAGVAAGHRVLDVGCGPGFATFDLAEVVGPTGEVIALDRSQRYLDRVAGRALPQVATRPCDLDRDDLPVPDATIDAAWVRWVLCFLARPRDLVARIARALKPGGVLVAHEYFDYRTWRASPRTPEIEEFVAAVMTSWRAQGGEPDIAMALVPWLSELGLEVTVTRPIVDLVSPRDPKWQWLAQFGDTGLTRLVELGHVPADREAPIRAAWQRLAARPESRLVTPAVLEVIAVRH